MYRQSRQTTFKNLQIITGALCTGVFLFLAVSFLLAKNKLALLPSADNLVLFYVGIGMAAVCTILSFVIFNNLLTQIDTSQPVSNKFSRYVAAYISRYALLEGSALFNTVIFLLSGCLVSAGIAIALLGIMLSLIPKRDKVKEDLKIYYPDTLD